jgi:heat shock protein HslJ
LTLLAVPFVLVAACGGSGVSATPGSDAGSIEGSWRLIAGRANGAELPVLPQHPITLTIEGSQLGGIAACNDYGAHMTMRNGIPSIGGISANAARCEDAALEPDAVMEAEAAYLGALAAVSAIAREGAELVLRGPGTELRFAALAPPPIDAIVGTSWVLETVVVGDVAGPPRGARATLDLRSDGSLGGSTGCRSFTGRWIEAGSQILATELSMDQSECPPALVAQDSHVVSVIGDGFVPSVEGDLLTLTDPGGVGLVYRSGDGD